MDCTHRNFYFTGGQKYLVCSDCKHAWECSGWLVPLDRHQDCHNHQRFVPPVVSSPYDATQATRRNLPIPEALRQWANWIASRYGCPVWQVGSSITQGWFARDVDVMVIMPDQEFENRWGIRPADYRIACHHPSHSYKIERLLKEMAKVARTTANHMFVNIDFKIVPQDDERLHQGKPKVRLDTLDLDDTTPGAVPW